MVILDEWSLNGPLTSIELKEARILTQLLPALGQVAPLFKELPAASTHPSFPGIGIAEASFSPPPPPPPPPSPAILPMLSSPSPPPPPITIPPAVEDALDSIEVMGESECEVESVIEQAQQETLISDILPQSKNVRNIRVELPKSTLMTPRSQHEGFVPPFPVQNERHAVSSLIKVLEARGEDPIHQDFIEFDLDQFAVYRNDHYSGNEMRALSFFSTKHQDGRFYIDGALSCGEFKFWVEKIEILELPIGNYGVANLAVEDQIWVRSLINGKKEIYYKLGKPAPEYKRFHSPFLWLADFAKHVVDYTSWMVEKRRDVSLDSFQSEFLQWLQKHEQYPGFQKWRRQHPSPDFRDSVSANAAFIWKEINGVLGEKKAFSLRLFREIFSFSQYKVTGAPLLPPISKKGDQSVAPTIVTPYVKECFGHMVLGKVLHAVGESQTPLTMAPLTPPKMTEPTHRGRSRQAVLHMPLQDIGRIQVGDVISTPRDGESTDTKWKRMAAKGVTEDHRWFGLVQKIHVGKGGFRSFDVTWLYRPVDTPCSMMKYPWPKELFFSDHCTCEEGCDKRVQETEVLAVHNFDWFVGPEYSGKGDFFVRQLYVVEHRRFVTLEKSHLRCTHQAPRHVFKTGDTVLAVLKPSDNFTEPYEVVKHFKQSSTTFVRLRKLTRRHRVDPKSNAPPNELLYTDKFVVVKPDKILGQCTVRFFCAGEQIPSPYNRKGTGNLFYITHRVELSPEGLSILPFDDKTSFPKSLAQGFDPNEPLRKLKGLDLFCGAGNLGRGLEDGGAVEMLWANDIKQQAIQTYMINTTTPNCSPFLGSIDDLLRLALEGKYADNIPRPGDVDIISAGSPCPGFSLLTINKSTLKQIKNQSLIASFASFVDFYRPKYALLENVPSIVQAAHNRSEDTLSQLFCTIVGLGYQAQLIMGDAWSHGTPQSRSRVFWWVAAPGLKLPDPPPLSHSHYPGAAPRGLGRLCTDEAYVKRSWTITPFKYVSVKEASQDLPRIDDAKVDVCIQFPDHRIGRTNTKALRERITAIPCHPYGMNIKKLWNYGKGVMNEGTMEMFLMEDTPEERKLRLLDTQGWSRLKPTDVFATVTATIPSPGDRRVTRTLHWIEGRALSVMEIRRAQGFLDEELLVGSVPDRWRLVGNSVARQMSLALGLKLREAWEESSRRGNNSRAVSVVFLDDEEQEENTGLATPSSVGDGGGRKRRLVVALGRVKKMQRLEVEVKEEEKKKEEEEQQAPTPPLEVSMSGVTIVRIPDSDEEEVEEEDGLVGGW